MAIVTGSIVGRIKGKSSGVVFSDWHGRNVMKSYNPSPRNPRTQAQTDQREKFNRVFRVVKETLAAQKQFFIAKAFELPLYNVLMSLALRNVSENNIQTTDINSEVLKTGFSEMPVAEFLSNGISGTYATLQFAFAPPSGNYQILLIVENRTEDTYTATTKTVAFPQFSGHITLNYTLEKPTPGSEIILRAAIRKIESNQISEYFTEHTSLPI